MQISRRKIAEKGMDSSSTKPSVSIVRKTANYGAVTIVESQLDKQKTVNMETRVHEIFSHSENFIKNVIKIS